MQTRKEEFIVFAKTIKNKVHDGWWVSFEFKHLWIARLIVYFTYLAVVVLVWFLLSYINLFHTDVNSARYMLSALVQSQAAIVAIVITLTLIAVQLTASAYSPRVIRIFRNNPDMWILLGCYGVSIYYGLFVLKLVQGVEGEFVSQSVIWYLGPFPISFESYVSLAYWLGAFTFVVLFPYMLNIISLLKSENIIKRLEIEIPKDKILNPKEDPVRSILNIIHGSIMKYDLETTRIGLKTVTDQVLENICADDEEEISGHFCNYLTRFGRLAISKEDEESTLVVIENLEYFGTSTAEKELETATVYAVWSLKKVEKAAAGKELEDAISQVAKSLGKVGTAAAGKELEGATQQVAKSLGEVGTTAAGKGFENASVYAVWSLENVGKAAVGIEPENATVLAARSLGEVGKAAAEKGLANATVNAGWSLEKVGKAAAGKGLENATAQVARSFVEVGKAAAGKKLGDVTQQVAVSLAELTIFEEKVKAVIQDYVSRDELDQEALQRFIKIYEQNLEKLRAKKN